MTFDFDKMMNLAKDDPHAFEVEREKLLREHIATLPEGQRQQAHILQVNLDIQRSKMSSPEFLTYLTERIYENLDTIEDLTNAALAMSEKNSDKKTRLDMINRVAYVNPGFTKPI